MTQNSETKQSWLKRFYYKPFETLDSLRPGVGGFIFNPFFKFRLNRKIALGIAVFLGLVPWMLFGFDSCIIQPIMLIYNLPAYLSGSLSYEGLINVWHQYYGKEMHYSAFLIYGLMYWFLSRHFDKKHGIIGSKNVAYTCALVFLAIGSFEFYWMGSYAYFQNQPWVISFRMPQLRIILQNIGFLCVGVLGVLYAWLDSYILDKNDDVIGRTYHFNWNLVSVSLIILTVFCAVLWWYYPDPVRTINVTLEDGSTWLSSTRFPQTLYTIDLNPYDSVNAGVWFFVEDNLVHGWNTLVKVLWSLTFLYIGKIKSINTYKRKEESINT